jgi:hypothetical protein
MAAGNLRRAGRKDKRPPDLYPRAQRGIEYVPKNSARVMKLPKF